MTERWDGHAPPNPLPGPVLLDTLLHPDLEESLVTAGVLFHFVASDPEILERFTAYVEHCPGDLGAGVVLGVLSACHDKVQPDCPDKIPSPVRDAIDGGG